MFLVVMLAGVVAGHCSIVVSATDDAPAAGRSGPILVHMDALSMKLRVAAPGFSCACAFVLLIVAAAAT
ncbi:MAG: hypothetical protein ACPL7K_07770, partial [Armatimonadota bacterium]